MRTSLIWPCTCHTSPLCPAVHALCACRACTVSCRACTVFCRAHVTQAHCVPAVHALCSAVHMSHKPTVFCRACTVFCRAHDHSARQSVRMSCMQRATSSVSPSCVPAAGRACAHSPRLPSPRTFCFAIGLQLIRDIEHMEGTAVFTHYIRNLLSVAGQAHMPSNANLCLFCSCSRT
jgi:hypothetical protein